MAEDLKISNDSKDFKTDGQCLCGSVKYSLKGEPIYSVACHCTNCRRVTGTSFVTNTIFYKKDFSWTESKAGSLREFKDKETDSGKPLSRYFCSNCGSPLFCTTPVWDVIVSIHAGTLLEQQTWKPTKEQYVECKAPWLPDLGVQDRHERGPLKK